MVKLYRLLYCSKPCLSKVPETYSCEIQEILAAARKNNARGGLTGALLFSEECFAQVLEGPRTMIEATFERIQFDQRHHKVTLLEFSPIMVRDFPDWSMAFAGLHAANNPLAEDALSAAFATASNVGEHVLRLLKQVVIREDEWVTLG